MRQKLVLNLLLLTFLGGHFVQGSVEISDQATMKKAASVLRCVRNIVQTKDSRLPDLQAVSEFALAVYQHPNDYDVLTKTEQKCKEAKSVDQKVLAYSSGKTKDSKKDLMNLVTTSPRVRNLLLNFADPTVICRRIGVGVVVAPIIFSIGGQISGHHCQSSDGRRWNEIGFGGQVGGVASGLGIPIDFFRGGYIRNGSGWMATRSGLKEVAAMFVVGGSSQGEPVSEYNASNGTSGARVSTEPTDEGYAISFGAAKNPVGEIAFKVWPLPGNDKVILDSLFNQ